MASEVIVRSHCGQAGIVFRRWEALVNVSEGSVFLNSKKIAQKREWLIR